MPMPIEKVYIATSYRGYISQLRMYGPIVHPIEVEKSMMIQMVVGGLPITQYDPATKQYAEVNLQNYNNPFGEKTSPVATPVIATPIKGTPVNPAPAPAAATEPAPMSSEPENEEPPEPKYAEDETPTDEAPTDGEPTDEAPAPLYAEGPTDEGTANGEPTAEATADETTESSEAPVTEPVVVNDHSGTSSKKRNKNRK